MGGRERPGGRRPGSETETPGAGHSDPGGDGEDVREFIRDDTPPGGNVVEDADRVFLSGRALPQKITN